MKKTIPFFLLGISMLILNSCFAGRPLVNAPAENNDSYRVQYLFEHDGCKVYRFYDQGNYVYFTNCGSSTTAISNDSTATYIRTVGR